MKSVLVSIKPQYCELIASGKKKIEVRKSTPKIQPPFTCYIYCTNPKDIQFYKGALYSYVDDHSHNLFDRCLNGKVIGEFVCDKVYRYTAEFARGKAREEGMDISDYEMERQSCLTQDELYRYENSNDSHRWGLLGWHISDLKIYDEPKELREFFVIDKKAVKECSLRERISTNPDYTHGVCLPGSYICKKTNDYCRGGCWKKALTRPPQSWCYVEEI